MSVTRRDLLAAGALGLVTAGVAKKAQAAAPDPVVRLAHITDVHLNGDRNAPQGVQALFAHIFGQADWRPELVLNTGDSVMAVDGKTSGAKAAEQIALWKDAIKACPAPIYSCLGNHDVWNGHEPTDEITVEQAGFKLMTDVLGMPAPYYSFDHGGWHFICLNSMCNWPQYASLSPDHFSWLQGDLAKNSLPTVVLSHVPILSVTSQLYGDHTRRGNDNVLPGNWHHADCWAISEVFRRHPQVKLCLSGHMHTQDRVNYRGVTFICGGAASGAWWNGSEYGFPPCYGKVHLFADGTFTYDFVDYGWTAREWRGKELKGG